jgi:hypothetical protein
MQDAVALTATDFVLLVLLALVLLYVLPRRLLRLVAQLRVSKP